MTYRGTRSRPPSRGSLAAAASARLVVGLALGAVACSSETPSATASPSPTPTAQARPSPSAVASSDETPVAQQVLPPATDQPVAKLCAKPIVTTADGNALPLACRNGALNVTAW